MLKHAFRVLLACGVMSLAQAGVGQSGVSRAPDPLNAFDLATFDARGLTVRYEKSLGGELAAIKDAISAHQDAEAEQAKKVRVIQEKADELIDQVDQIIGLSPTKEQRESQQRIFGDCLKKLGSGALFAPVGGRTVCLLTRKSIKEHMRKGGALPWFSYDAKEDSVTYNLQIDLHGGMADVRELIIPIEGQTAAKDLSRVLAVLGRVRRTDWVAGLALHELSEISMMSYRFRTAPGDPYWRWFSEGFANAVAAHVLKKHFGAEESAAFAGSYDTTPFMQMKEQVDLRHWMGLGLSIEAPVESEQRLKEARYAFATQEALRVTDKYGIDVVGRILDNACKGAVNESGNLAAAIQAVTGQDIGKRLDAYQSFANEDEGIAGHAKAFNAAMDRKDYAAALPHLLRIHELRCKKEGRPDPGFYANAALVLFRMGMEQAGDRVILDHADFCKGNGATGAYVAMHALFIDYALKCRNLKKAIASSDVVLAAKPDDVPALAIRMLKLADSDMIRAKEIAARIVRLDGESNSSWVMIAKKILEAKTTSTAPSAGPREGQPAPLTGKPGPSTP